MRNFKNKDKTVKIGFAVLVTLIICAIIICVIIAHKKPDDVNSPKGADPTLFPNPESSSLLDEEPIVVHNIKIDDFDEWGMGVLSNNKYYQLQYGVHLKDASFLGDQLGITSAQNKLTSVEGDIYQYSESASYLIDDNSPYYVFNGSDDVILVDTGEVDTTIGGYWVMASDLLPKTSFYDFLESPEGIVLTYYPTIEDISYSYNVEAPEEFIKTFQRVSSPLANSVESGYITFDDNSGLLYGMLVYYDYDTGECYLSPPTYPNLCYKAGTQLGKYIQLYYSFSLSTNLTRF